MGPEFLQLYNDELSFMRGMGAEFAGAFPKIAGRLGMEGEAVADPYVERLMEGFAFMAARVQHKLRARFPDFTQHLLEQVYPHFLAPIPAMAMVQYVPDPEAGRLERGYVIPRGTRLFSRQVVGGTPCEFRSAQDVTIWPVAIAGIEYYAEPSQISALDLPPGLAARAALRIRLVTTNGLPFNRLRLRSLRLHGQGRDGLGALLAMHLLGDGAGVVVRPVARPFAWQEVLPPDALWHPGLAPEEALLPPTPRTFDGYRLLQEHFALPERALGVEIAQLANAITQAGEATLDLLIPLRRGEMRLHRQIGQQSLALFVTPAINLFERACDPVPVTEREHEHHVVVDRLHKANFEVHSITAMRGTGEGEQTAPLEFRPFYSLGAAGAEEASGYYTLRRARRLLPQGERAAGTRTGYLGSETFVSLVAPGLAADPARVRQLAVRVLCSNRDLPLLLQPGHAGTDFTLESGAPVSAIRLLGTPGRPRESAAQGDVAWQLISHLTLNYLSITSAEGAPGEGREALRALLRLYADPDDQAMARQIEGVRDVSARPLLRRLPGRGHAAMARGLEVRLTLDEAAFEGIGVFPLGAALARFFAGYATVNSFTETVLLTLQRGEVMRWPMTAGRRAML